MSPQQARPQAGRRPVIELRGITKTYGTEAAEVHALAGVDLLVERGDYVAIMGASGSGKSTMMNIIGCLDTPTRGRYLLDGLDTRRLSERQQAIIRNRKIGFVFQAFNLVPRLSALENVELPMAYAGMKAPQRRQQALAALDRVGLTDRISHHPTTLSGGQQQRVALARAIVTNPVLLLADEPTGALDSKSSADVLSLFDALSLSGRTVVVITHEPDVAAHAKRIIRMLDGRIVSDERQTALTDPPPRWPRQAAHPEAGSASPSSAASRAAIA